MADVTLAVRTIVDARGVPWVVIAHDGHEVTVSIDAASAHAAVLVDAVASARADAFLLSFMAECAGVAAGVNAIERFRLWRKQREEAPALTM